MAVRKKILWLVSWYPNKYDAFDGDFVQRHATAAAVYDDIHLLFLKQHEEQSEVEKELRETGGLTEKIVYLPKQKGFFGKLNNHWQWQKFYKAEVDELVSIYLPDIIHVQVPWKAGLVALWAKRKYQLPYIITEHWGIYNHIVADNIHTKSFLQQWLLKKIYKEAKTFVTVSCFLGDSVNKTLLKKRYTVIPNVVDTNLFLPTDVKHSRFTFLHVSNMAPLKNVGIIINSFHKFLKQTDTDAQLILIGNRDSQYPELAKKIGLLNQSVFFKGEVAYESVAKEMQLSHVFVLCSDTETFSCVTAEAICCGLPVIAAGRGALPELINSNNGLLVASINENELCDTMLKIFRHYHHFNLHQIALAAREKFSFAVVGRQFHELYLET